MSEVEYHTDHEHCTDYGECWQVHYPCPTLRLRKRTLFQPCAHHEASYARESRERRAEVMVEGGWAHSPCPDGLCWMRPGTDFYNADFVAKFSVYRVGTDV